MIRDWDVRRNDGVSHSRVSLLASTFYLAMGRPLLQPRFGDGNMTSIIHEFVFNITLLGQKQGWPGSSGAHAGRKKKYSREGHVERSTTPHKRTCVGGLRKERGEVKAGFVVLRGGRADAG